MTYKHEILRLRSEGKTYDEIHNILCCSKSTISYYCGEGQKTKNKLRTKKFREKPQSTVSYKLKSCLYCQKETKNPKFCNVECCGKFYNHKQPKYCKGCNILLSIGWCNHVFCKVCLKSSANPNYKDWSTVLLSDFFIKLATYQANARIRSLARELYKKSNKPKFCTYCGYSKFYEVCHIKPIADFPKETTSIAQVNHIDNLIALCPNCHWELDHKLIILNKERQI